MMLPARLPRSAWRRCAAAVWGLVVITMPAVAAEPRPRLDGAQSLVAWNAYLGETFEVWGGQGARRVEGLRLASIEVLPASPPVSQFVVQFTAKPDSTLEKGVYGVRHPQSGEFELWLDPVGADPAARRFAARFSLLESAPRRPAGARR